nr:MAG TPA: holin [Caudoviricetes sp.]
METILNTILTPLPAWLALVLIVVGTVSLALGLIRLGYGAAVRTLVLDLIDQAEHEIQGTKRGAERKEWCVKMLRHYLDNSRWGKLVSWAITEETMSKAVQFFFDRAKAALGKEA